MSSKKFWTLVVLLIFVPIYALALYLVIEGAENSIMPFILLTIGALALPKLIKNLFSKESEEEKKEEKKSNFRTFVRLGGVVSLVVSAGLWIMNSKYGGLTSTEIIGIGVSTFICFLLIYFFMWFLPKKMDIDE